MRDLSTKYEDSIKCPHCEWEFVDSWEYNDMTSGGMINCENCDEPMHLEVNVSITYSTWKVDYEGNRLETER